MIRMRREPNSRLVYLEASGKLTRTDYDRLLPDLEAALGEAGRVRMLIELTDFRGWEPGAAWEDLKFGIQHRKDFERIAVVGEKGWERWGTMLSKPFLPGEMRFFEKDQAGQARAWIQG